MRSQKQAHKTGCIKPVTGGTHLEELEETLRGRLMFDWVKLCIISDHNIAIGWYRNNGEKPPTTTVCVFTATHESWLEGLSIRQMEGTTRTFRKRQRTIARWYYRELCQSFKDGIFVVSGSKKTSLGRWD